MLASEDLAAVSPLTITNNGMPPWNHTLTVDASYDHTNGVTGIGIVVQQRAGGKGRGPIIDGIAEGHTDVVAGAGELFAVLRALEIAAERGFARIKLRSDYNPMRRALRRDYMAGREDVGLRGRVLRLSRSFAWIDFGYVRRRKNLIADEFARRGRLALAHELACRRVDPKADTEMCSDIPW